MSVLIFISVLVILEHQATLNKMLPLQLAEIN